MKRKRSDAAPFLLHKPCENIFLKIFALRTKISCIFVAQKTYQAMLYPTLSEYKEAILLAEDNFNVLTYLRPVLDEDGQPVMTSGNFAVVFKMKDAQTGKLYAVKCFTREQEGREEAYRLIDDELKRVDSPYLTSIRYLDKELFVDTSQSTETEFPVLLMDWVEGKTLDKYLRENLDNKYALEMLAYRFSHLALFLISQPFAHGDLKPDNILVQGDGFLVLVDYDGMYVPAMKGQKARELGSPDFRHPQRTEDDFDEYIDDFPLVSILLSLKAISISPQLLDEYGASDRLLFSQRDYRNLADSQLMDAIKKLMTYTELAILQSLFLLVHNQRSLFQLSSLLFDISSPLETDYDEQKIIVTDVDLKKALIDDSGNQYSADKKRLLKGTTEYQSVYSIKEGTEIICSKSLSHYGTLVIPKSLRMIALDAFSDIPPLEIINKSPHFVLIDGILFSNNYRTLIWCSRKKRSLYIPVSVNKIGIRALTHSIELSSIIVDRRNPRYDSRNNCNAIIESSADILVKGCTNTVIPKGVVKIAQNAFRGCNLNYGFKIPNGVKAIDDFAFYHCRSIFSIDLPPSLLYIGESAFEGCKLFHSIKIPNNVISIGKKAFCSCNPSYIEVGDNNTVYDSRKGCNAIIETSSNTLILGCKSSVIPVGVTTIGNDSFSGCSDLKHIDLPDGIIFIGDSAFSDCKSLKSIKIPSSVKTIGKCSFWSCTSLKSLVIPNNVVDIGEGAFRFSGIKKIQLSCNLKELKDDIFAQSQITSITLPDSIEIIGNRVFGDSSLNHIKMPVSLRCIGNYAFTETFIKELEFPENIQTIEEKAFEWCFSLKRIIVPKGLKEYYQNMLKKCHIGSYLDKYEGQDTPFYASEIIVEMK